MLRSSTRLVPSVARRTPARWTALRARGRLTWYLGLNAVAVLVALSILAPVTTFPGHNLALATAEESDLTLTRPDVASVQMVLPDALHAIRYLVQIQVFLIAVVAVWRTNPTISVGLPGWGMFEPFRPVGRRRRALLQVYRN